MSPGHADKGSSVGGGPFQATRWSVVLRAGDAASPEGRAALEELCRRYWYPLYGYVRRRGHDAHDAQDLTQAFFAHLLERGTFSAAEAGRGRFRSFLLGSLNYFLAHERERGQALKRGGGQVFLSLDDQLTAERFDLEPQDASAPDVLFEKRWAEALLAGVLERFRGEMNAAGEQERFEVLRPFLLQEKGLSYREAAARLGLSEDAVKSAIKRLRQQFRKRFFDEIAQTVADPLEVEDEARHLLRVLTG